MDVNAAIAKVARIVERPDKNARILDCINEAILMYSKKADFSQDVVETSLVISPTSYGDTISLSGLTGFRKVHYLKPTGARFVLKEIDPNQLLSDGGILLKNRFYVAGSNLTYVLADLYPSLELGYYKLPAELDTITNTTHWMLEVMPYCIINKVAASIFFMVGDDASARYYLSLSTEEFKVTRSDLSSQVGNRAE